MAREGTYEWASDLLRSGPSGVNEWNRWREQGGRFLDLSGIVLRRANLCGVNLRGIKLWDAQLDGADLADANLGGAYLNRADLSGARLTGANLGGANLRGTQLTAANVEGANLRYSLNLSQAQLDTTVGVPAQLPEELEQRS